MDLSRISAAMNRRSGAFLLVGISSFSGIRIFEKGSEEKRKRVREALATGGYRIAPVSVYFDDWAWNEAYARCADKKDETGISILKSTFLDSARRQFQWTKEMSVKSEAPDAKQILLVHIGAFDAV